jgi:hypothetical protein
MRLARSHELRVPARCGAGATALLPDLEDPDDT